MTVREVLLTPLDRALLRALSTDDRLVDACERLGIGRHRGLYRLRRLSRAMGRPITTGLRGGASHGSTRLTDAGRSLLRWPAGAPVASGRRGSAPSHRLRGRWADGDPPHVEIGPELTLAVAFPARPGEEVEIAIDPESVIVATERFPTSARNVLPGRVARLRRSGPGTAPGRWQLEVDAGGPTIPAAVTPSAVRSLGLRVGRRVYLYVKATSVTRLDGPTPGSPRW